MPMAREEYADPKSFTRLLSSIGAAWIEEALEATGSATIRKQRLPAEQVVWLVLGMALDARGFDKISGAYFSLSKGVDTTPLFQGLEGNLCQCPHWGFVVVSRVVGEMKMAHSSG